MLLSCVGILFVTFPWTSKAPCIYQVVFTVWFTIAYFPVEPNPTGITAGKHSGQKNKEPGRGNYNILSDLGLTPSSPQTLGRSAALEQYKAKFPGGRTYVPGPKNWRGLETNLKVSAEWASSARCQQCSRALRVWTLLHRQLLPTSLKAEYLRRPVWCCKGELRSSLGDEWSSQWPSFDTSVHAYEWVTSKGLNLSWCCGLCPPRGHAHIYILTRQIHWRHEGSECCLDYNEVLLYYRTARQGNLLSHPRRKSF